MKSTLIYIVFVLLSVKTFCFVQDAEEGEYPFAVSLLVRDEATGEQISYCTGSIIHEKFILTSANCISSHYSIENTSVYVGSIEEPGNGSTVLAEKMILFNQWSINNPDVFNIGLIKLRKRLVFGPVIQSIGLNLLPVPGGVYPLTAVGWSLDVNQITESNTESDMQIYRLKAVNVTSVDWLNCRQKLNGFINRFRLGDICVNQSLNSLCNWNSGSPLIFRGKVAGVLSKRPTDCTEESPVVWTGVVPFVGWIKGQIFIETLLDRIFGK